MNIAGIVTVYRHDVNDLINNIKTYIDWIDCLLIVDNNEKSDLEDIICATFPKYKISYVNFPDNKGIAAALNFALTKFNTFDFLLTMDQDSYFKNGDFDKFLLEIKDYHCDYDVIMFAPYFNGDKCNDRYQMKLRTITSGGILNIKKAISIGGFDDCLFIDEVDHEFCYRAKKRGYKIVQCNKIELIHQLGETIEHQVLYVTMRISNHSALRRYYMVRNSLYVMRKYPYITLVDYNYIKALFFMLVGILLFEDNKKNKIKYMVRGMADFFRGKMGKFIR